ncbi:conserved hypothetical protein [Ricinus communis]|uniref:Uncharacterized protein n=1 Tax=Ricinus communis TaxID=3988 RepID=B9TE49_RICCO|nr:conserved hypothetical protein [Ricinus communis]
MLAQILWRCDEYPAVILGKRQRHIIGMLKKAEPDRDIDGVAKNVRHVVGQRELQNELRMQALKLRQPG